MSRQLDIAVVPSPEFQRQSPEDLSAYDGIPKQRLNVERPRDQYSNSRGSIPGLQNQVRMPFLSSAGV